MVASGVAGVFITPSPLLARRGTGDHVLLTTLVASALPHLLNKVFDQERPDRRTVSRHWRGIPFSDKRLDAFPSSHAVHIGALASAVGATADLFRCEERKRFSVPPMASERS